MIIMRITALSSVSMGVPLLTAWAVRRSWQRTDRHVRRSVWRWASAYSALRDEQAGPARHGYLDDTRRSSGPARPIPGAHQATLREWDTTRPGYPWRTLAQ